MRRSTCPAPYFFFSFSPKIKGATTGLPISDKLPRGTDPPEDGDLSLGEKEGEDTGPLLDRVDAISPSKIHAQLHTVLEGRIEVSTRALFRKPLYVILKKISVRAFPSFDLPIWLYMR